MFKSTLLILELLNTDNQNKQKSLSQCNVNQSAEKSSVIGFFVLAAESFFLFHILLFVDNSSKDWKNSRRLIGELWTCEELRGELFDIPAPSKIHNACNLNGLLAGYSTRYKDVAGFDIVGFFRRRGTCRRSRMPTMPSVLEEELESFTVYSPHVDSTGITVELPSPNSKPLKNYADVQTLLQQGRKQDVKYIIRNNFWPIDSPIRAKLWPLLCGQHHIGKSDMMDGFYSDMVTQVFGSTELPDRTISLPQFVEPSHCQSYYLTHRGRNVADRVVSVLGYACPDIVYSPTIYPICAILLHYMSVCLSSWHSLIYQENTWVSKLRIITIKFQESFSVRRVAEELHINKSTMLSVKCSFTRVPSE
ncbi:rab-gap/tbc-related [Holotrichia oblita]|uniref:Rab-gap/tbc-related n=1 Tax=Holotrichia oblita TaxID=644536 RepID=A0ACB9TFT8_HOLOL|nr:rab-gap/tbc-related [Holotrichia oblita]